jgi:hypothetical protein
MNAAEILEKAAEILEKAAEILEVNGHCKWALRDAQGRHCALGAINQALVGDPFDLKGAGWLIVNRFASAILPHVNDGLPVVAVATCFNEPVDLLVDWNNRPERTGADVIEAFRLAAKDLRNEAVPA